MNDAGGKDFGRLLRRFRRDAELSQEALAERAGLSVRGIGDLERGVSRAPYRATVVQIADALGLSPEDRASLLAASRRPLPGGMARRPAPVPVLRPLTPLIGRDREMEDVAGRLRGGRSRLLTLTGPGGVGKTRLALEVAVRLQDSIPDGVCVVHLDALRDSDLVLDTIAQALGMTNVGGDRAAKELADALAPREMLLLVDNMEHLLDASPVLARLLAACSGLRILVTSRSPLRIEGEQEYPVGPLRTPDPMYAPPVQALTSYPAVELYVQRVESVRPEFRLTDANAMTVVEICSRLDGLPLALELAAARSKLLPPQALARGLAGGLWLLGGGGPERAERHRSIEDAIDWSYALLSPDEQHLFARLSVFAGGWSTNAAKAVCEQPDGHRVLESLSNLLDHSLVRQFGDTEPRFSMLQPLREYATGKLEESGMLERVRTLHARYYAGLAEDFGQRLAGAQVSDALAVFEAEHNNMRAALAWSVERNAAEVALRLIYGLYGFWYLRGHVSEGRTWIARALSLAGEAPPDVQANAWKAAGTLALRANDLDEARSFLQRALDIYLRLGDFAGQIDILRQLGTTSGEVGDLGHGIELLEQALELGRRHHNRWGIAACLDNLGSLYGRVGEHQGAMACLREAVQVATRASIPGIAAGSTCLLGQELVVLESWSEAEAHFAEGLRLAHSIGFVTYMAEALEGLASCAAHGGRADSAVALLGASSALRQRHDLPHRQVEEILESPAFAHVQDRLGWEKFSRLWDEGNRMSTEEAAEHGLNGHGQSASLAKGQESQGSSTGFVAT